MWILNYFPGWIFTLLFFLGIAVYLITQTIKTLPQAAVIRYVSVAIIFLATYFSGAKADHDAWKQRTQELEKKVVELESQSQKTNTQIVTKTVTKQQIVREKADEIIKYVDREVVKYDQSCDIPREVIQSHNKAAK